MNHKIFKLLKLFSAADKFFLYNTIKKRFFLVHTYSTLLIISEEDTPTLTNDVIGKLLIGKDDFCSPTKKMFVKSIQSCSATTRYYAFWANLAQKQNQNCGSRFIDGSISICKILLDPYNFTGSGS